MPKKREGGEAIEETSKIEKVHSDKVGNIINYYRFSDFCRCRKCITVKVESVKPDELIRRDRSNQETAVVPTELKEHDKVRVIVEVEGDPLISYSIEKVKIIKIYQKQKK
ncbi:hypothetical protein V7161_26115 [Neobacillus drentensis]|uniref:hypothetical protein n=1 Tax=Neobacillus drentensis TaxID=220684 RepID=UPI0030023791